MYGLVFRSKVRDGKSARDNTVSSVKIYNPVLSMKTLQTISKT